MSREMLYGQGWDWQLPRLFGEVVSRLYGFTESPDDAKPEKVILQTESNENHSFYISAGGFWAQLTDEELVDVEGDYEGMRRIDYTDRFSLNGQIIQEVRCDWIQPGLIAIRIRLDHCVIELRNNDCMSEDSEDILWWIDSAQLAAGGSEEGPPAKGGIP